MKRAMQLKAVMKRLAEEKGISAQLALQNYMLERLLERLVLSGYRRHFILKGGLLISAMAGLDARTTMDMDGTVRRMPLTVARAKTMFREICAVPVGDGVSFAVKGAEGIRENDAYGGIRLALEARCPPMAVPLKVDLTAGDKITPREIAFDYPLLQEDRTLRVMAYNLETLLAEKLETILSRGNLNTRMRDFYDVYLLRKLPGQRIDLAVLRKALNATAHRRGTLPLLARHRETMKTIATDETLAGRWEIYRRDFGYAKGIEYAGLCRAISLLLARLLPREAN